MAKTKKTKAWVIEEWANLVRSGTMPIEKIADASDRRRVLKMIDQMEKPQKPVDPRKMICRDLETAAGRVHHVGGEPASDKQCWFIAGLLLDQGLKADAVGMGCLNTQAMLTKRKASQIINELKGGR